MMPYLGPIGMRKKLQELRGQYAAALYRRISAETEVEEIERELDALLEDAMLMQGYVRAGEQGE